MKQLFSISLLIVLLISGCADKNTFIQPVNNSNTNSNKSLIQLPLKSSLSVEDEYSTIQLINGTSGGSISLTGNFTTQLNSQVTFTANTNFPGGVFQGSTQISITISDFAGVDFLPSIQFDAPVSINLGFTGLDLSGIQENSLIFAYIAPDGSFEPVDNGGITVDYATGTLAVHNALLNHFSRYAFIH